ncbi:MAG: nuclear transport factor 2 family protein [Planctomycetaceae bacterium]|nr:nuclear transport factor 2 family protein [Planctomycetaceae bacterium]
MLHRKILLALPLVAFLTTTVFAHESEQQKKSPREFIADWVTTFNKNNPALQTAFYEQSEEIEVLVSSGFRHQGYKAVQKAYTEDQKNLHYYDSEARNISTRVLDDTALVTFEHLFKIQFLEDDSRWQIHIRTTSVLRNIKGEWKIVLEHSSSIRGVERMIPIEE